MNRVLPVEEHAQIPNPDVSGSNGGHHPSAEATETVAGCLTLPLSVFSL